MILTKMVPYRYTPRMENKSAYFRNGSGEYQRKVKYRLEK